MNCLKKEPVNKYPMRVAKSTKTSSFGVSGRYNHDSSKFYESGLYKHIKTAVKAEREETEETAVPSHSLNRIYCKSSEKMDEIPDSSIHLMITSPPYNATKEYDEDLTLTDYIALLNRVFQETYSKLTDGGRACINIANLGRKPYIPIHSYIINIMNEIGYLMRGEIIWDKGASAGGSCAWGSWKSASNPVLRDTHEYILIFSKGSFSRKKRNAENTISREDFLELTKSIWTFPAVSARSVGHPAPFPEELPRRLIELYSFLGDVVLDPFCGSGTTCISALKCGRGYVGYDINPQYAEMARNRIDSADKTLQVCLNS